jgi:hypothetical protein
MSVVEQKKESIRVALQELGHPTCKTSTIKAMETLHRALCHDFGAIGFIGDFVGDDDFKEEIFSARVIQLVMEASQDKEEYTLNFYHHACSILCNLCINSTELATTFVTDGGVAFLLESLESFSSDQFLLITCFSVFMSVNLTLDRNQSVAFAGRTLEKLVDAFQLNFETQSGYFYRHYCTAIGGSLVPGCGVGIKLFQRIVSHVWHGVIKHKHNDQAQDIGRSLLRQLVGEETAKEMIDHAEMHHCEDEGCAGCA